MTAIPIRSSCPWYPWKTENEWTFEFGKHTRWKEKSLKSFVKLYSWFKNIENIIKLQNYNCYENFNTAFTRLARAFDNMNDKNNAKEIDNDDDVSMCLTLACLKAMGVREQTLNSFNPLKHSIKVSDSPRGFNANERTKRISFLCTCVRCGCVINGSNMIITCV